MPPARSLLEDLTDATPVPVSPAPPPSFDQQVVDALQGLLPVGGSMLGSAVGSPLGLLGMTGGAAMGYELGDRTARMGQQLADWLLPVPAGTSTSLGRSMQKPSSVPQEALRTGENLLTGAAGEAGGQVVGKAIIQPAIKAISRRLPSATPGARAAQAQLQEVGSRLTPAQFSESRTLDIMEGIAEGSLLGGPIEAVKKGQQSAVQALVERTLASVDTKMGTRGVAELLTDTVRGKRIWGKALQRAAYKEVDAAAGPVLVDTSDFVQFADEALAKNQANVKRALDASVPNWRQLLTRPESQATVFVPHLTPRAGREVPSRILTPQGAPYTVTTPASQNLREVAQITHTPGAPEAPFSVVANARAQLLQLSRKKALAPEDEIVTKTAGMLASKLDDAIETSAGRLAPAGLTAFREANALTKRLEQTLNNETVRAVIRRLSAQPAKLANVLLTPNNVDVLDTVRDAVPGAWPTIQSKLAEISLVRAADPTRQGQFSGPALLQHLKRLGPETAEAAFGKETVA